jgi:hypothetical protein
LLVSSGNQLEQKIKIMSFVSKVNEEKNGRNWEARKMARLVVSKGN